jgi:hypothetical protein
VPSIQKLGIILENKVFQKISLDSFDGTTSNSLGGAELAQGGGFSCKNKT